MPLTVPVTLWALAIVGVLVAPPALLMLLLWRFWWRTRRDMSRAAEAFGLELETRFLAARQARDRATINSKRGFKASDQVTHTNTIRS